jgi:ABC-type dipeptide/oligopeptide/nickel transport system permease component
MKNWRKHLVLMIGIMLVLISLVIYVIRITETFLPAGSTPQQIQQMTQAYGLDRPVIEQYGWFLFTFLPGLTLLGIYATLGIKRPDFQQGLLAKILIIIMLITNTVTMLNFVVTAHASLQDSLAAFWTALVVAFLALANFAFLLVVWNGYKWGLWAYGVSSFVLCTLKFVGLTPIFPVLFEFSAVLILFYLIRFSWDEME